MTDEIEFVEPRVGVLAARTFDVSQGRFQSAFHGADQDVWATSTGVAKCQPRYVTVKWHAGGGTSTTILPIGGREPETEPHEPPGENCSCGLYSFITAQEVFRQYSERAQECLAVVAPEGVSLEGQLGWRSPKATIVAVWLRSPLHRSSIAENYPDVKVYDDLAALLHDYPAIDDGTGTDGCKPPTVLTTFTLRSSTKAFTFTVNLADPADIERVNAEMAPIGARIDAQRGGLYITTALPVSVSNATFGPGSGGPLSPTTPPDPQPARPDTRGQRRNPKPSKQPPFWAARMDGRKR